MSPLVDPSEIDGFEAFCASLFNEDPGYPPNSGFTCPFGYGTCSVNDFGVPYHDREGKTTFSEYGIIAPVINIAERRAVTASTNVFLFNLHSLRNFGEVMDEVYSCSLANSMNDCSSLMYPDHLYTGAEPMTTVIQPIYPNLGPREIVGFIYFGIGWTYLLESAVGTADMETVYCVITTNTDAAYTYRVDNQGATLLERGDTHDSEHDSDAKRVQVALTGSAVTASNIYHLTVYPTDEYYDSFHTNSPILIAVGMVVAIFVTSCIFFIYDFTVKKDSLAKEQIMVAKRQFVRFVSHEIRTPLNTVSLCMKLLSSQIEGSYANQPEDVKQELLSTTEDVQVSTTSAILILNDLLNYDKIESGNFKLDMRQIPMWKFLQTTLSPFHIQAQQASIDYSLDLVIKRDGHNENDDAVEEGGTLCTHGDPLRLTQVLRNIVSNALKFTPPGGSVKVSVMWSDGWNIADVAVTKTESAAKMHDPTGDTIVISVKDSGAGISKENQLELFKEGMQFNANVLQAGQGSGLGLCISKNIVELHKGRLWAESEGEKMGSTFLVQLPVAIVANFVEEDAKYVGSVQGDDAFRKHKVLTRMMSSGGETPTYCDSDSGDSGTTAKVLVVDDTILNRKVLCRLLSKAGYECVQAVDGVDCLERLREKNKRCFSAILMDYQMPRMTGPEATSILRKEGYNMLIIGVTGNVMPEDVKYFMDCGANMVMQKPFDVDAFMKLCPVNLAPLERVSKQENTDGVASL